MAAGKVSDATSRATSWAVQWCGVEGHGPLPHGSKVFCAPQAVESVPTSVTMTRAMRMAFYRTPGWRSGFPRPGAPQRPASTSSIHELRQSCDSGAAH